MSVFDGKSYHQDMVHYLTADIAYTDGTVSLGWLPKDALVIDGAITVTVAFNAGTNNNFNMGFRNAGDGTADDVDEFMSAVAGATVGQKKADDLATAGDLYFSDGAELVASYAPSGTAASAGAGKAWVAYLVLSND